MNQASFREFYAQKKYDEIIGNSDTISESLSLENIVFLLKSIIHRENEDDPRVRDLLFLFLFLQKTISFHGSFTLSINKQFTTLAEIEDFGKSRSLMIEAIESDAPIDHILKQYERLIEGKEQQINNKETLLLIIFCCLELYDLEHDEYPLVKWLLNHFYKHE